MLTFYGFGTTINGHQRGQLKSFADPAGNTITLHYNGLGQMDQATRGDGTVSETWTYTYEPRDPENPNVPDHLSGVELSRNGTAVRSMTYEYYGKDDLNGDDGDLKEAKLLDSSGQPLEAHGYFYPNMQLVMIEPPQFARWAASLGDTDLGSRIMDIGPSGEDYMTWASDGNFVVAIGLDTRSYYTAWPIQPVDNGMGMNIWSNVRAVSGGNGTDLVYSNYLGEVLFDALIPGPWPMPGDLFSRTLDAIGPDHPQWDNDRACRDA